MTSPTFTYELAERYSAALTENATHVLWAAAFLAVVALPLVIARPRRVPAWVTALLVLPVVGVAVYGAWELAWVADDAYISFRYAQNLILGRGLVLNPGENVEGYTNFLWTMMMASGMAMGLHPVHVSVVLGLASLAGALGLTTLIARTMMPGGERVTFSFAALGLAVSYGFTNFGTSGLETMFGAMLVLLALKLAHGERYLGASVVGVLAIMVHPDHLLFWVALGAAVLWERPRLDVARRYAWPLVALVVWTAWRWWYYGSLLPCTYYAKSGGSAYFDQGFKYIGISFLASGLLGAVPLFVVGAVRGHRLLIVRFGVIATVLYLAYVAKIGGDFMLARLLVPWIPIYLLVAEAGARSLFVGPWPWRVAAVPAVLLLALGIIPNGVVRPGEKWNHVADERTFYVLESFNPPKVATAQKRMSDVVTQHFVKHHLRPRLGIGCMGLVAYETDLPIFDNFGLAEPIVAHMKLAERARPGHEKLASPGHLLQGNVDLADIPIYPRPYDRLATGRLSGLHFFVGKFDPKIMDPLLKQPGVMINDFRRHLDAIIEEPPPAGEPTACDLWFMNQFYFHWAKDEERRRRIIEAFVNQDPSLRGAQEFLVEPLPKGYKPVLRFSFNPGDLAHWKRAGNGFENEPRTEDSPGQHISFGRDGGFVSSYHAELRDEAMGTLESPPFVINGDVLTFQVSGGQDLARIGVALLVNGRTERAATGCYTELMGRRAWDVSPWRGQKVTLGIYDNSPGGWGHIAVDEVVLWARD